VTRVALRAALAWQVAPPSLARGGGRGGAGGGGAGSGWGGGRGGGGDEDGDEDGGGGGGDDGVGTRVGAILWDPEDFRRRASRVVRTAEDLTFGGGGAMAAVVRALQLDQHLVGRRTCKP